MTGDVESLAAGIADRIWTRVAARERLEALDETASGPTLVDRIGTRPELLDALVDEALDDTLTAVTTAARRAQLRALREGGATATGIAEELVRAGLAQASWTGEQVGPSSAGEAASRLIDGLAEKVAAALRERLAGRHVP